MTDARPLLHAKLTALPKIDPQWSTGGCAQYPDLDADIDAVAGDFLRSVFDASPYLTRLARRRPDILRDGMNQPPEVMLRNCLAAVSQAGERSADIPALETALRQAKADMHLLVALADLCRRWSVTQAVQAVTQFADAAVAAALLAHVRFLSQRGLALPVQDANNPLPGLFILALGKMGACELNYSSDIDLICFFDADVVQLPDGQEMRKHLPRLVQAVMRSLQEQTSEGYVFRTDLRLRPDPGASPVAMSTDAALHYYESLGQTWERAAWIKARPCAGDQKAAEQFQTWMQPFIWRRSLDFAAVDDIRNLARQIQTVGRRARISPAGHDLKLGRGGIREIEFFAQVPQLVFGGRDPNVRTQATLDSLRALSGREAVSNDALKALSADYSKLRSWEHRVQMLQDEASQTLPDDEAQRAAIASLSGFGDLARFDEEVEGVLRRVHGHFSDQFHDAEDSMSSQAGSLVLTGVEPTPDTILTLETLGFDDPALVWKTLSDWTAGRVRAVRSPRARTLLAKLAPRLLDAMSQTGEPDAAFLRFVVFFENLPFGVQPLSLMMNEPGLAADLVGILTMAPRMAQTLARRPAMLDVMLDARFSTPLADDAPDAFLSRLKRLVAAADGYEDILNIARRAVREERYRVGAQVLRGAADAQTAGAAYTAIADAAVECMAQAAQAETCRRYGDMPGHYVILGMGKLGGGELSADSDIDLVIVYDGEETSQQWFTRFAQRFISALSVPTEEGELYEVDMQLRPSGRAGPVAVRLSRFSSYYYEEAWTWELMALTRARTVSGNAGLAETVAIAIDRALEKPRSPGDLLDDARDMRARLERDKPASGVWDLKARIGGLQDIEFIAQSLQVVHADKDVVRGGTASAFSALVRTGIMSIEDARFLTETAHIYLGISQLIRSAHGTGFDPDGASSGFAQLLAGLGKVNSLRALQEELQGRSKRVRALFTRYLQPDAVHRDGN
jgi:glutamate-ammonia-ligase adenylyltransferase